MCSACIIYFSDLKVGLVNTWCLRSILKLNVCDCCCICSITRLLLLKFGCISEWRGTLQCSQKPLVCGSGTLQDALIPCAFWHKMWLWVCMCLHMCACGESIQFHNLPWSLNHIRFQTANNKTTEWQKSKGTAGNCPQAEKNTHLHKQAHREMVQQWPVRIFQKQIMFIWKEHFL